LRDRILDRWLGIVLVLLGVAATVWLAFTGQLELYIHPRYVIFSVVMAALGGALAILAIAVAPEPTHHDDADHVRRPLLSGVRFASAAALVLVAVGVLVVLPPATLSASTAQQREVNSTALDEPADSTELQGADSTSFTVKTWASVLRSGPTPDYLATHPLDVVGIVLPDADDPDNVFFVARFSITCCAVDATPIGVAVYEPGWSASLAEGDWVRVAGSVDFTPSSSSSEIYAVIPDTIEPVSEPDDPYLY
jgi:uncharacterized repeat protein (TIGR03943 family)